MSTAEDIVLSIEKYRARSQVSSSIAELNDIGIKRFEFIGYPSRKDEMYSFVDLRGIDFSGLVLCTDRGFYSSGGLRDGEVYKECLDNVLVFRYGIFDR